MKVRHKGNQFRKTALLLAAVLTLSGCGGNTEPPAESETEEEQTAMQTETEDTDADQAGAEAESTSETDTALVDEL